MGDYSLTPEARELRNKYLRERYAKRKNKKQTERASDEYIEAYREYRRRYYAANADKYKEAQRRYWEKRAREAAATNENN